MRSTACPASALLTTSSSTSSELPPMEDNSADTDLRILPTSAWPRRGLPTSAHAYVFASVAAPVVVLVMTFSVTGFGDATYLALVAWDWPWWGPFLVDLGVLLVLWCLDAHRWRNMIALGAAGAVLIVGAGVGCSLATKIYPFAPLQLALLVRQLLLIPRPLCLPRLARALAAALLALPEVVNGSVDRVSTAQVIPISVYAVRQLALRYCSARHFFVSLSNSLAAVAAMLLLYFVLWVYVLPPPASRVATGWQPGWVNVWGGDVKMYWRRRLRCEAFDETLTEADDNACFDAAFLWCGSSRSWTP